MSLTARKQLTKRGWKEEGKRVKYYSYMHVCIYTYNGLYALTGNKRREKFALMINLCIAMLSNCKRFNSTCEKIC